MQSELSNASAAASLPAPTPSRWLQEVGDDDEEDSDEDDDGGDGDEDDHLKIWICEVMYLRIHNLISDNIKYVWTIGVMILLTHT